MLRNCFGLFEPYKNYPDESTFLHPGIVCPDHSTDRDPAHQAGAAGYASFQRPVHSYHAEIRFLANDALRIFHFHITEPINPYTYENRLTFQTGMPVHCLCGTDGTPDTQIPA